MTVSLFRRGFIQTHVGKQTRGMDRWHWSFGSDGPDWFSWSVHVPQVTVWFCMKYREVRK